MGVKSRDVKYTTDGVLNTCLLHRVQSVRCTTAALFVTIRVNRQKNVVLAVK